MKIVLTTHNYWPYFRRGSSRHIHNLTRYLIRKGHMVHVITSKPGELKSITEGNLRITYHPYLMHPLLRNHGIERFHGFIYSAFRSLFAEDSDVTYCMFHTDGFAARIVHFLKRKKYVLNVTAVPFRYYWKNSRIDELMFKSAVHSAERCINPSHFAEQSMEKNFGIKGDVIPMSVDLNHFKPTNNDRSKEPSILFVSAADDMRKGIFLLLRAFEELHKRLPDAKLMIASQMAPGYLHYLRKAIPDSIKSNVEIIGQGKLNDLPLLYAKSSVTVLPSLHEVFGMVLIESLACGTPVVGSNSGAIPEIITNPEIGVLFDPEEQHGHPTNAFGLYEALLRALELSKLPATPGKCQEHASVYDLNEVGSKIENLLLSVC